VGFGDIHQKKCKIRKTLPGALGDPKLEGERLTSQKNAGFLAVLEVGSAKKISIITKHQTDI
jgi:hypothetical protein